MNIVYFLMVMALLLVGTMLGLFVFASHTGQFDDLETPARRALLEDEEIKES